MNYNITVFTVSDVTTQKFRIKSNSVFLIKLLETLQHYNIHPYNTSGQFQIIIIYVTIQDSLLKRINVK